MGVGAGKIHTRAGRPADRHSTDRCQTGRRWLSGKSSIIARARDTHARTVILASGTGSDEAEHAVDPRPCLTLRDIHPVGILGATMVPGSRVGAHRAV